ncbi:hypothetical protein G6O69_21775 [Pseudenhygromyxa sp. WMMC2535]|uniref:hypothetical protein n=1 Tax=Pseudenhygromyxa sp. WMMC2535 TaxID=2712867 RepID=UPI0015953FBA|nr:hypothetical protein [Pseudenhygromyxa sp. WMMC2535]NVB40485.1 hypothetical protein [Pseudenhygromyxa sp. WMMC2535]
MIAALMHGAFQRETEEVEDRREGWKASMCSESRGPRLRVAGASEELLLAGVQGLLDRGEGSRLGAPPRVLHGVCRRAVWRISRDGTLRA